MAIASAIVLLAPTVSVPLSGRIPGCGVPSAIVCPSSVAIVVNSTGTAVVKVKLPFFCATSSAGTGAPVCVARSVVTLPLPTGTGIVTPPG